MFGRTAEVIPGWNNQGVYLYTEIKFPNISSLKKICRFQKNKIKIRKGLTSLLFQMTYYNLFSRVGY